MSTGHLHLSNIEVRRGGRSILSVQNLQIRRGEFVGVIGTNGAGKTTLLNVCCGLIRPNSGMVRLCERELTKLNGWQKANLRRRIAYTPQGTEYNAELPFTLREIVAMGRAATRGLFHRLNKTDYDLVDDWIERLGLSERQRQVFRSLSGGEQQKTLIARAMVQDPQMLLLDEPCANLDFNWKYRLTEIIERLYREKRMTILMVSHETDLLPPSCSRTVLLHEGRILADGQTREVLRSEAFARAYQCEIDVVDAAGRMYAVSKRRS
jgi:ABC-type cobalamin/Fe3+-siderophores transport system ATPase subunit